MTCKKFLSQILDLEEPFAEADKKLVNTIMIVNGKLMVVKEFSYEEGENWDILCNPTSEEKGESSKRLRVTSLEVWLPESGLYPVSNGGALLVTKIPKRQWLKSFSLSFYSVVPLSLSSPRNGWHEWDSTRMINAVFGSKRTDIFVDGQKEIYYLSTPIGAILSDTQVLCTNKQYEQELKDWIRDAN